MNKKQKSEITETFQDFFNTLNRKDVARNVIVETKKTTARAVVFYDYISERYKALISSTEVSLGLPGRQASS